jgi:hypothetical protein
MKKMTCGKCKYNREIARLLDSQKRLREICSKCHLGETIAGDNSVSLDNIADGTAGRVVDVVPTARTCHTIDHELDRIDEPDEEISAEKKTMDALTTLLACVAAIPYEQLGRLVRVAKVFETLDRTDFEIVSHLLNGGTMISYAQTHGLTKQTAFARIKNLFKAHPIFRTIANGNLTHGKGGRVALPKKTTQLSLFDY